MSASSLPSWLKLERYWSVAAGELQTRLQTSDRGLTSTEAAQRLDDCGPDEVRQEGSPSRVRLLLRQLRSPLLLLLFFAAAAALVTREWGDATMVIIIAIASVGIAYHREYDAQRAAQALRARLDIRALVWREGALRRIPAREVVPGDIVQLSAGGLVPGDGVVLEASDLFVGEAILTGEGFPVEKTPGVAAPDAGLAQRRNCVFLGSSVRSGSGRCLVVATGSGTEFGRVARRLARHRPETDFERGTRRFGTMLMACTLGLVLLVFLVHIRSGRSLTETLLFALALAVGLSPELLPAILSVNLAKGAHALARRGVLVRHLDAIENLGSMNVLCTDKTGTLTEGVVALEGSYDPQGRPDPAVLELARVNAKLQSGVPNPMDGAILAACTAVSECPPKLAEIPFDAVRRRVSVVIQQEQGARLITKGAIEPMLAVCRQGAQPLPDGSALDARIAAWSDRGIRVLGIATRSLDERPHYGRSDEQELELAGFLTFVDRPKADAGDALAALRRLGVSTKMITGDHRQVARYVAEAVGLPARRVMTGGELAQLSDPALWRAAEQTDLFVEVDPHQKERIIVALKRMGHVVGFLGDGVNDAAAMWAADVSLSVDHAVDVARDAADFVLLEQELDVIRGGIEEGRRTFANTLKYVQMTTSANLGNMLSMALASLVLPFLPLTPGQILLNNLLSDLPAMGIAQDQVDPELVERPGRWDLPLLLRFMLAFGVLSAVFDVLTFGVLIGGYHARDEMFRSAWFIESLLTELVIALVLRTRRPFYRSRPGTVLWTTTLGLIVLTPVLPYLPPLRLLGLVPLGPSLLLAILSITLLYVLTTELVKRQVFGRLSAPAGANHGGPV